MREFEAFDSEAKAKKNLRAAIERVAARLGNTPTVCRNCYIHPQVLDCYVEGALLLQVKDAVEDELREDLGRLTPEEAAVLGLLQSRLSKNDAGAGSPAKPPAARRGRRQSSAAPGAPSKPARRNAVSEAEDRATR